MTGTAEEATPGTMCEIEIDRGTEIETGTVTVIAIVIAGKGTGTEIIGAVIAPRTAVTAIETKVAIAEGHHPPKTELLKLHAVRLMISLRISAPCLLVS